MNDRPKGSDARGEPGRRGGPDYDWLYGTERGGAGATGDESAPGRSSGDPEPTRVMPTRPRRDAERPGRAPAAPPPRAPRRPAPPRRARRRRWLRPLLLLLLLWLVFLVAVPFWAWSKVDQTAAEPPGDRPPEQPGKTFLLVGSDSREGMTAEERRQLGTGDASGRRTDTIMLLHTGSGPNLLMSIPRDSIVDVPGRGTTKINAAYAFGGPRLLVQTLESETGIRIDEYVEIGFSGFVNVVDAVGGIEICPDEAMEDPQANLRIQAGCQEADGTTALGYARSRKLSALGDVDRARRQREVVSAVGREALSPWNVVNPVRYVQLTGSGAASLRVGRQTGVFDMARFGWAMTRVDGENGLTCSVPIADLAVNWDRERADRLFRLIAEDRTGDVGPGLCGPSGLADR